MRFFLNFVSNDFFFFLTVKMFLFIYNSTLERSLERAKRKSQSRLKKLESEIEIMVSTHTLQVIFIIINNVEK